MGFDIRAGNVSPRVLTESPSAYSLTLPGPADVQNWLRIQVPGVRAEKVV